MKFKRPTEIKIILHDNEISVSTKEYIEAKTLDLKDFGFPSVTTEDVGIQLDNILQDKKLTIVGQLIKDDIVIGGKI